MPIIVFRAARPSSHSPQPYSADRMFKSQTHILRTGDTHSDDRMFASCISMLLFSKLNKMFFGYFDLNSLYKVIKSSYIFP